jgi:membrane fusion protein, multidrug efflux system
MEKKEKGKRNKMFIPLAVIVLIVLITGIYWYRDYSKYISTDDAHVDSDNVAVSPKIPGRIAHLYFEEGDTVKTGKLVAELDSSDILSQKKAAMAGLDLNYASLKNTEAKLLVDEENIKLREVSYEKAKEDFDRAKNQFASDVISKEQFDHVKKAFESEQVQLNIAKYQLNLSKTQINTASAQIENAKAALGVIQAQQLNNTKLYAPMDGIVAKRWLLAGDIAQPGQSIYTVTNNKKLWVVVFLEETKVSELHIGQKAEFKIDAFSGVEFVGKIFSIGSNTASQFSLIPANNASGNFTKVTQRVSLKISIDGTAEGNDLSKYHILSGMSVEAKIIKD